MTVTYNVLRFLLRISKVILSNFIHQLVIERKENKKQYTINTKIQSICKIIKRNIFTNSFRNTISNDLTMLQVMPNKSLAFFEEDVW